MTALDGLKEARRLVAEVGWTKGALARDEHFQRVLPQNHEAVCFCAVGALQRALPQGEARNTAAKHIRTIIDGEIWEFNDAPGHTRAEVIDAFDCAIALAEADAGQEGGK